MNMSKLKKIKFFLVVVLFTSNINAQAFYYINKNGTRLSKCEYDFIQKISNNDVLENINEVERSIIFEKVSCTSNILTNDIELFGTEHTTKSKSLNISKSCNGNNCIISTTLKWLRLPTIRSYDVFGAYLEGTHLTNQNIITYVNDINYNQSKIENNGFGVSLKLPTAGNSIVITQIYNVNKSGIVYSSYQHATSNISKSSSMKYSISKKEYGNVFLFENSVSAYYDKMGGVSISI